MRYEFEFLLNAGGRDGTVGRGEIWDHVRCQSDLWSII